MNEEIKELLDFKEDADYKRLSVDEITALRDYITNLQNKIEAYELFDNQKIAKLQEENERLNNIIKEVREYIYNKEINTLHFNSKDFLDTSIATELLEILDKVGEE